MASNFTQDQLILMRSTVDEIVKVRLCWENLDTCRVHILNHEDPQQTIRSLIEHQDYGLMTAPVFTVCNYVDHYVNQYLLYSTITRELIDDLHTTKLIVEQVSNRDSEKLFSNIYCLLYLNVRKVVDILSETVYNVGLESKSDHTMMREYLNHLMLKEDGFSLVHNDAVRSGTINFKIFNLINSVTETKHCANVPYVISKRGT